MRISDWSSDVCSSDLLVQGPGAAGFGQCGEATFADADVWIRQIPAVAGEHCADHALDFFVLARVEEDRRQAAVVPAFDEAAERLDADLQRLGEFAIPVDRLVAQLPAEHAGARKRVVEGKSVSVSVDLGGGRIIKKKKE